MLCGPFPVATFLQEGGNLGRRVGRSEGLAGLSAHLSTGQAGSSLCRAPPRAVEGRGKAAVSLATYTDTVNTAEQGGRVDTGHRVGRKDPWSGRNSVLRSSSRRGLACGPREWGCGNQVWSSLLTGGVQGRAQYRTDSASHPAPAPQRGAWAGHSHVPRTAPHRDVEGPWGP